MTITLQPAKNPLNRTCDIIGDPFLHKQRCGNPAYVDAKSKAGPWGYFCLHHMATDMVPNSMLMTNISDRTITIQVNPATSDVVAIAISPDPDPELKVTISDSFLPPTPDDLTAEERLLMAIFGNEHETQGKVDEGDDLLEPDLLEEEDHVESGMTAEVLGLSPVPPVASTPAPRADLSGVEAVAKLLPPGLYVFHRGNHNFTENKGDRLVEGPNFGNSDAHSYAAFMNDVHKCSDYYVKEIN